MKEHHMREPLLPQLSADDFLSWESRQAEKYELHHGFIFDFAGGSVDHAQISINVVAAFRRVFPPPCRTFSSDLKIRVGESSFFYPDASVVCTGLDPLATYAAHPHVVAEVLSPSTRAYDLVEKRAAYRSIVSLAFYVIVHTAFRRIEIDSRDGSGEWKTRTYDSGGDAGGELLATSEVYADSSLAL